MVCHNKTMQNVSQLRLFKQAKHSRHKRNNPCTYALVSQTLWEHIFIYTQYKYMHVCVLCQNHPIHINIRIKTHKRGFSSVQTTRTDSGKTESQGAKTENLFLFITKDKNTVHETFTAQKPSRALTAREAHELHDSDTVKTFHERHPMKPVV